MSGELSVKELKDIADILRRDSIRMTTSAGSGHPTSCLSCAEILSALFFRQMSYDNKDPKNIENDEFILSKGHAAPILYSALYRAGCINHNLGDLRKLNSPLEGHPMPRSLDWVKVATGSLGQGLSVGLGMALAGKYQDKNYRTYVLLGDSELAEGSVYEALQLAGYYKLNNLIAILDINRLGQRGPTMVQHDIRTYKSRLGSFGWNVTAVDGHNIGQLLKALKKSEKSKKPSTIIAKTFKGKGVSFLENKEGWHGKALSLGKMEEAFKEIPNPKMPRVKIKKPSKSVQKLRKRSPRLNQYSEGDEVATRQAYGNALAVMAKSNPEIIAIDAEVSNSTHSEEVKKETPSQFIETFIAEQNMIGIALGLSKKGLAPFASTFSAFLSRAHDQIRMSALSSADMTISGSHCGVSIGEDGASQMGLEDIASFRAFPNSIVFYPSDAISAEKLTLLSSKLKGIKYIRTTRPKTPVIYKNSDFFKAGDFKILRQSKKDKAVLIGAGVTLHESLRAHDLLRSRNVQTAVIDLYCIKPLNHKKLASFIKNHGNKAVITEDHYKEGGLGEAVQSALKNTGVKINHLAVAGIPHSGKKDQLLEKHKISARHIAQSALSL